MSNANIIKQLFTGIVSVIIVLALSLLVLPTDIDVREVRGAEAAITPAPRTVLEIRAPELSPAVLAAEREFLVPMHRLKVELPDLPEIRVDRVRERAAAWLGEGIIAAPARIAEADAPEVLGDRDLADAVIDVPDLERPELPSPPRVR